MYTKRGDVAACHVVWFLINFNLWRWSCAYVGVKNLVVKLKLILRNYMAIFEFLAALLLKIQAVRFFEKLVTVYQLTRLNTSEDHSL